MPLRNRSLLFYIAIALVQGGLLSVSLSLRRIELYTFFGTLAVVAGINLQLLGSEVRQRGTWILVVGLSLLLAGLSGWVMIHDAYGWMGSLWPFMWLVLAYIGTAFILSWPTREGHRPRYQDLFRHAWNNAFIVLLALLVTLAFSLLLWLCGRLFSILGVPQLGDLFTSSYFLCFSLPLFFSLGMRMGRENEKVIGLLRGILLTVCRYLLPLSALITVIFSLALVFSGLQPIWATGYSTPILLVLVGSVLLLLNGVFQDGRQALPYPRPLLRLVELSLLCLPLLAGLATYSSWLRVEQYGLSPQRFLGVLLTLVVGAYALAAAWAVVLRSQPWLNSLRISNPLLAVLCCALLLALNTPLLNPLRLSAEDQVGRLRSGALKPEAFDVRALRFDLGKPGEQAFEALRADLEQGRILDADGREALRRRIGVEAQSYKEQYTEEQARRRQLPLEWLGPKPPGSEQFVELSLESGSPCQTHGCALWAVDLDLDGQAEVVALALEVTADTESSSRIYARREDGLWVENGELLWGQMRGFMDVKVLIEDIRKGRVKVTPPRYQQLQSSDMLLTPLLRE